MQISILSGIYADSSADFRTSLPRNLVPVPKKNGISDGYLRPADGVESLGTGPGADRGAINWNGVQYRVLGTKLCSVSSAGAVTVLGDVGSGGPVRMDYSFDRLIVPSGGRLYYLQGSTLKQVTDPDLGAVISAKWAAGYTVTTDGTSLVVSDLTDPTSVDPLKYGSAESDPDPVMAVEELRNEVYALGRYTVEVFQNVGGTGFPFARIDGAQVGKGIIGTHAYCEVSDTFAFVGSARKEAPAVYTLAPGGAQKISTREIDTLLLGYTEAQLSAIRMESRIDKAHQHVLIHLPDQCLVYDAAASAAMQMPIWFKLTTSVTGLGQYRATGLVWCYDRWCVGDPQSGAVGRLTDQVATHWGAMIGWDFGTAIVYNGGSGAIVHELELVCLTGHVAPGVDPVIWTSYSVDGETWSQERSTKAGKQGQRSKRIAWRSQGQIGHWRVQRFRGTSDARLSVARLEAQIEPLFTKATPYG